LSAHPIDLPIPADAPAGHVDGNLVVQALLNLLDDIAKYTPSGTRAQMRAEPLEDFMRVIVEDEGPGLPSGERDRVFVSATARKTPWLALVLASRSVAPAFRRVREIQAGERPGGGAPFEFTQPTQEPAS
jgi:two-component system, OmpR family, sensor histidine kinase KdpD